MGKTTPPKKDYPFLWKDPDSGLPPNTWFLGRTLVHIPNGVSIGSAVFAGLASGDHRQRIDKYLDTFLPIKHLGRRCHRPLPKGSSQDGGLPELLPNVNIVLSTPLLATKCREVSHCVTDCVNNRLPLLTGHSWALLRMVHSTRQYCQSGLGYRGISRSRPALSHGLTPVFAINTRVKTQHQTQV